MKRNVKDVEATHRKLSRRALLLGGMQLAFAGGLAMRMRHLQVDQADQFRLLAEENRINLRLIPPARGQIYDRNGTILAQNSQSYRITVVPEDAGDVGDVIDKLSRLLTLDPEDIERAMAEMRRSPPFLPITLADQISWDDISKVAVNAPALPGITPEVGLTRVYPQQEDFAHVVGYVGPVSDYDLSKMEDPEPVLMIPRFQIGKVGFEAKREDVLRGKAGAKRVEVNATGRVMRELDRREGEAGADMQLTVDADLQYYTQARLGKESASAVVIDCESGDVRAIASSPSFDPNLFVRGISVADYRMLTEDPYRPLANKSVQGTYPPGSTFKMITALAALEEGLIGTEDTVWCPGHLEVSGRRFHCWKRAGHGHVDLNTSLKSSCDVYYYDLAIKVGIDKISAMAKRFGLGVRHDLPMSAVAKGIAPNKEWKSKTYGQDWLVGDTVNSSIGQGYLLASPMQLAVMTARLATGRSVTPRLLKSIDGVEQPSGAGDPIGVNENNLRTIRRGMYSVSNERRGTGYRSRIIADGMRMAGKSGTSQVRNITAAERAAGVIRNEDLPWERRDHALFVAYAPADAPKFAVAVVVEHGGGGSKAAAPIARDVLLQALYDGSPPLEAYPKKDRTNIEALQERLERERIQRNRDSGSDQA
ncbi:penicillin-binding protein 2 [Phaeobacter gallaeciensis]|uniref:Penicillin-binding protein 2 n=1 Tax=Phaeobacter gallaeciensis TaxID=60890 RepID=A0AAC9Z7J7_9RHOB|nr:penicillin-binding protein 2 [Phaeobacter gallaeciensis]AHD08559.1 penicillin-binding protein 2 [Phaeobacter gallaeciensis DSM 26640]ATE91825.1 penicillin-binding protein 2 [Phaeobacter gallaeciensis]ATE98351.1 penicillin-binding protein 2 [Phaeobacter gallaeciensis]ATF00441.1 penicillin-binding protein 2 [Phaeobacter gallaeciensis]ATF04873.1 penicillin-binding protein 2 [Phaeobacter gallaeciensis]